MHGSGLNHKNARLLAVLKGPAAYWLDSYQFASWNDFENGLEQRFSEDPEKILEKLMSIKQTDKTGKFVDDFRMLVHQVNESGTIVPEAMKMIFFVDGLRAEVRWKVKDHRPLDLDQAISDARYVERELDASKSASYASPIPQDINTAGQPYQPPHVRNNRNNQHCRMQRPHQPFRSPPPSAPAPNLQVDELSRRMDFGPQQN